MEAKKYFQKMVLIRNHRPDTSSTVRGFFFAIMKQHISATLILYFVKYFEFATHCNKENSS